MRIKVGKCVIRHNEEEYGENDVFEIDKKYGERLIGRGVAKETSESTTVDSKKKEKSTPIDAEALFENTEDFNSLKVDELKAVCVYMDLPVAGNKGELVAAIEAASEVVEDDETVVSE